MDEFLTDADGNQSNRQNFWGFNPKLGAIYEINRQTQAFMNFSRSWQPPSLDNLVEFTEGPNSSVVYTPLHRNTPGPLKSELAESIRGFSGSYRFIAPGFVMSCWNLMIGSGMISEQQTSSDRFTKESRQAWKLNCFGKS